VNFDTYSYYTTFPNCFRFCNRAILPFPIVSGFVTDENVKQRELKLRNALRGDSQFQVKQNAFVEVSQV